MLWGQGVSEGGVRLLECNDIGGWGGSRGEGMDNGFGEMTVSIVGKEGEWKCVGQGGGGGGRRRRKGCICRGVGTSCTWLGHP